LKCRLSSDRVGIILTDRLPALNKRVHDISLVNSDEAVVSRRLFLSAVFWLGITVLEGLFMAVLLAAPSAQVLLPQDLKPILNFGRVRPLHVTVALFGWLSMAYAASMLFLVPRLVSAPLYSPRIGKLTVWLWNILMLLAVVTFPLGMTQGREYAEMIWPLDLLFLIIMILLAVNLWGTVFQNAGVRRKGRPLYITVWNSMLAVLLAPMVFAVGNKVWDPAGAYAGMNDNIINFFYVHNIFNVWFTTGGLGLALYLIPRLTDRPLFSHRLAFWGLLTVWTGQHHQLWSPAPDWLEILTVGFSVLAIIPNTAFFWNFWMTARGAWSRAASDLPVRFLFTFVAFYMLTCAQGVLHSFRSFSSYIHFTNWVVGHSHLAFVAGYSFLVFAMIYYLFPRVSGRNWFSERLIRWHYWMSLVGVVVFMVSLWAVGIMQAEDWRAGGIPFIETVRAMKPYMVVRLLGGAILGIGQFLLIYNVFRSLAATGTGQSFSETSR
jgi:cytochrome c oxidase cbb3-type subunit 1